MWLLAVSSALGGYADAVGGLPTWADRETFAWTNAVRVDPAAFQYEYPCDFALFLPNEQTPKPSLRFDADLSAAASYHSNDMNDQSYFAHDSLDGTSWSTRIWSFYSGSSIGENIAFGQSTPYAAVVDGWMCSPGHRANIMNSAWFDELGTGVAGRYYTQDFGGYGSAADRAMAMGIHRPEDPVADVDLVVDWDDTAAPDEIYVVLDGVRVDLGLLIGAPERGVYGVTAGATGYCQQYYFVGVVGDAVETWPEDGSYGWGACAWDDAGARWLATQIPVPGVPTDTTTTTTTTDTGIVITIGTDTETSPGEETGDTGLSGDTGADTGKPTLPEACACRGSGSSGSGSLLPLLGVVLARRRRSAR